MAVKKSKAKKAAVRQSESYLARRPYLTIAVLAALVIALAFTVEMIDNALRLEAFTPFGGI